MPGPQGFTYEQRADGAVVITHGARAGNYKRGNERSARAHPRNRG
ncbi:hypothetical protein ABZ366_29410 [Streptomyces sp. NPDC005904]